MYWKLRRPQDAEPLLKRVVTGRRHVLGEEHPLTLSSMHFLASVYRSQRRYEEAEALFRSLLGAARRAMSEDSPLILASAGSLAIVVASQGRYDEAELLYKDALEGFRRAFGEKNPDTVKCVNKLALLYEAQKRHKDAVALLDHHEDKKNDALWEPGDVQPIVRRGSAWKYQLARSDQGKEGTTWRRNDFDDQAWHSGPAPLGRGVGGLGTTLASGPGEKKAATVHFRHTFTIGASEAYEGLKIRLRRVGGAAVYLNTTEVVRDKRPPRSSGVPRSLYQVFLIPADLLRPGENTIAASVHPSKTERGKVFFDLGLDARRE
jgi:tetratricopeptide (TPR) repeat protein